jgi:hypothetical protein
MFGALNFQLFSGRGISKISVSMSLIHASQRAGSRGTCLRSSYLGISHFFRTRHYGIAPSCVAKRSFSSSQSWREEIKPDEKLRKSLEEFKATSMSSIAFTSPNTYLVQ